MDVRWERFPEFGCSMGEGPGTQCAEFDDCKPADEDRRGREEV